MTIINDKDVTLFFDKNIPCVDLLWSGFVPPARFRDIITHVLEFIKAKSQEYPHIQLLADTRKLGAVTTENVEWMAGEIDPQLYKYGVRKAAFIIPENLFTLRSLNLYEEKVKEEEGKLVPGQFSEIEEAKNWLKPKAG